MAPAELLSGGTLLIGGKPRAGTGWTDTEQVGSLEGCHREVLLQTGLEAVSDPWLLLRQIRDHIAANGILTLRSALPAAATLALLRLAHFQTVEAPNSGQYRACPTPINLRARSCTVVVPCKDEVGNIAEAVRRLPPLGTHTELIFVDGGSTDGTREEIEIQIRAHPERDIRLQHQTGAGGKAAAVFQGFDAARGEVLMILDADLTVAPEDLPRFYLALAENAAQFANGNRLVFPMEPGAMPSANRAGNRVFARVLSVMAGMRLGDTLCGTKALFREDWLRLAVIRARFGGHDPWGDFDLLLGAASLGLSVVDVPVRYYARTEGESKMRPYRHGLALARTCAAALPSRPWRHR